MRRTILLQVLLAVCVVLPACGDDDEMQPETAADKPTQEVQETNLVPIVLHANSQSDGSSLKTYINDREVFFREGDVVSVFDGEGNRKFTAVNEGSSSDFEGYAKEVKDNKYYILYPYQESAYYSEGTISAVWPSTQIATPNSYDPLALLSVAHYDNENKSFSLKNVGSLLKFEILNTYQKIVLRSIEKGEAIAGNVSVGGLADGYRSYTVTNPESEITLLPGEDGIIEAGTYFIAFLPCAQSGLYLDFYSNDVCVWSKELRPNNLVRNKIYRVKSPEPPKEDEDGE